jgi:hypothetical protein
MAISSVSSGNPLDQLARSLVDRFDANKDGQLTTDEFTSFLSSFLNSVSTGTGNAFGLSGAVPGALPPSSGPKSPMEGFDAAKLADPSHDHVKYKFARVALNYSLNSVTDKASAGALLDSMKADLQAAGIDVLGVKGDKIQVNDDAGQPAWIDVMRGAGRGGAAAWQWMATRF